LKKEQILQSAKELFEKYGIKKTTMNEIAQNAGVTKKTVYSYFESKADLINCFIQQELNYMKSIIEKYLNKEGDFFNNVHAGLYELLTYRKESFIVNLVAKESDSLDIKKVKEALNRIDDQINSFIKQIIINAEKSGYIEVQNIDVTTFIIYKMYIALMFEWDENYKELKDKEIADNVLHILRNGLKAKNK